LPTRKIAYASVLLDMEVNVRPSEVQLSHVAAAAKCPIRILVKIARDTSLHYKPTRMELIGDKLRPLDVPVKAFKVQLRRIHRFIQNELPGHKAAHGSVSGKSCFTAANEHLGKPCIVTRDMKDCYPSISTAALKQRLIARGFRCDVAWLLARLMTVRDLVPQGSPLSGDALNLFMYDGDEAISLVVGKKGNVTRSADDIVVSFADPALRDVVETEIERQIVNHGVKVNEKKRAENGFQASSQIQLVHNIEVNSSLGTKINATHTTTAVEIGLRYVLAARHVSADSLEIVAELRQKVHGWTHYCRQAKRGPARYVRRLLSQGDRLVSMALQRADVTKSKKWWIKSKRRNRPATFAQRWRRKNLNRSIAAMNQSLLASPHCPHD